MDLHKRKRLRLTPRLLILLHFLCLPISDLHANIPVFPGAEGFGTKTSAGRGGIICQVTNLMDSGVGSFRSCLEISGARIIIFRVGGEIKVKSTLNVSQPFVSILGQTAPGDGIMVRADDHVTGPVLKISTHDVLLQHLRLRAGASVMESCCRDALSIGNKTPNNVFNVVVDHVSMSWGSDEVADIWYDSNNITISRSIISEGLNKSTNIGTKKLGGRGFIIGSRGSHSISFHHNFLAHNYQRNPLVKSVGVTDVVSNLVYHWVSRAAGVEAEYGDTRVNFVNNKFIAMNSRDPRQSSDRRWGDISIEAHGHKVSIYLDQNYGYRRKYFFQSQSRLLGVGRNKYVKSLNYLSDERHSAPKITETPFSSLETELIKDVGANLPRQDSTDLRLFRELVTRKGKMTDCVSETDAPSREVCKNNVGGWPVYMATAGELDTDNDGIPDEWEYANGLNKFDPSDAISTHKSGYMQVERWAHSMER